MAYINQKQYYTNNSVNPTDTNWGSYQYVSLTDIVTNFLSVSYTHLTLPTNREV